MNAAAKRPQSGFDPADPQLVADPEAIFARLRDDEPLCRSVVAGQPIVVLSRYADVATVLDDPTTLMRQPGTDAPQAYGSGPAAVLWRNAMSMMDPPDHTRVRRLLAKAFTRRRMEGMRPHVSAVVRDILERVSRSGKAEIVSDLAVEVPMRVICEMLGIEDHDWPRLQAWTPDVLRMFVPGVNTPDEVARVHSASQNFIDYFGALLDERRLRPTDDLTTAFVQLQDEPDGLTRGELIGALRGLLTAGFETTAATISAAVMGFAQQPDQFDLLRERRVAVPAAVEELLRWETPVQLLVRYLGREMQIDQKLLPAGTAVWLLLGAANHDPRRFSDPGRLKFDRDDGAHHSFGGGRHFCLGAYLARVELQVVLEELSRDWRRIRLRRSGVDRRQHFQFRSIAELPVTFERNSDTVH